MKKQLSAQEQFDSVYRKADVPSRPAPAMVAESPPFYQQAQAFPAEEGEAFGGMPAPPPPPPGAVPLMPQAPGGAYYPHSSTMKGRKNMPDQEQFRIKTSEELQQEKEVIKIRETGFWLWKTVIVPPNAYVIHTRRGQKEPITLGLGVSFSYNPYTDSYLVVPAAMQTIGIVANCITREKQGINILAYVQWLISDFAVAYQKLDFSDVQNPVAIVNAQLREQAEAAIKDKIATMSVEDVLTDKEPIIEELTTRMKTVAEGRGKGGSDEGLGLKIVTVQIKEALVSSQSLWSNLQAPFRHEKEKEARLSQLALDEEIHKKQLENRLTMEIREAGTSTDIKKIQAEKSTEAYQVEVQESAQRFQLEQENAKHKIQIEENTTLTQRQSERKLRQDNEQDERFKIKVAEETTLIRRESQRKLAQEEADALQQQKILELERQKKLEEAQLSFEEAHEDIELKIAYCKHALQQVIQANQQKLVQLAKEAELALLNQTHQAELERETNRCVLSNQQAEKELEFLHTEQGIMNGLSEANLKERFIRQLPELAEKMPKIDELRTIQFDGVGDRGAMDTLSQFITKMVLLFDTVRAKLPVSPETITQAEKTVGTTDSPD